MRRARSGLLDLILLVLSVTVSLVMIELGWRALDGRDVLVWRNWFVWGRELLSVHVSNVYDPLLGWRLADNLRNEMMHTTVHGLRYTSREEPNLYPGQIVAVGDSFTAGSEVYDHQTWPAHLEQLLSRTVLNAGVGAYGTDQIVLRGEQMLDLLRPEILIVGFLEADIARTNYSLYGGGLKPYFTIESGQLVAHHYPVPRTASMPTKGDPWLGYAYTYYRALQALAPRTWSESLGPQYTKAENDPVAVTCLLLDRLKKKADIMGTKLFLLMQYGGGIIHEYATPPRSAQVVMRCSENAGFHVIDEFDALRAIAVRDPQALKKLYVMHDSNTVYGHMSSDGNRLIAGLVAAAIQNKASEQTPARAARAPDQLVSLAQPDRGWEIIAGEKLPRDKFGLANVRYVTASLDQGQGIYDLIADGPDSEHYLSSVHLETQPGRHTLSIWIDRSRTKAVRLQLHDVRSTGAAMDVFSDDEVTLLQERGGARAAGGKIAAEGDWVRYTLTAELTADKVYTIVQVLDHNGSSSFPPRGESVRFRALRLERVMD